MDRDTARVSSERRKTPSRSTSDPRESRAPRRPDPRHSGRRAASSPADPGVRKSGKPRKRRAPTATRPIIPVELKIFARALATSTCNLARERSNGLRAATLRLAPQILRGAHVGLTILRSCAASLWGHRPLLFRSTYRLAWWIALAILLIVGKAVFRGTGDSALLNEAHLYMGFGLALCATVLVCAIERRMRWAAFVLGACHGSLALLVWVAQS